MPVKTNARIVIVGAGAAGAALANRLVRRFDGAAITIIDPSQSHLYQPGLSLVAAGLKPGCCMPAPNGPVRIWKTAPTMWLPHCWPPLPN